MKPGSKKDETEREREREKQRVREIHGGKGSKGWVAFQC